MTPGPGRSRRDWRRAGALATLALVLLAGAALDAHQGSSLVENEKATQSHAGEIRTRFEQAVLMLHARQYEHAAVALHRVLALAPGMAEAHVNMGFAMIGQQQPELARRWFESALALRPTQANAYYGLALAFEAQGDRAMATGAMRSYLHLAREERGEHLSRARAALWEWDSTRKPR